MFKQHPHIGYKFFFYTLAVLSLSGVALEMINTYYRAGFYSDSNAVRVVNLFSFFTIQTNVLISLTSFLRARSNTRSELFWNVQVGLVGAITFIAIVQYSVLYKPPTGFGIVSDPIIHALVPFLTVVGWLIFGPRRQITAKTILQSSIFPLSWLAFTMLRGSIEGWYPYEFIDVNKVGVAGALRNNLILLGIFYGLLALMALYEREQSNSKS